MESTGLRHRDGNSSCAKTRVRGVIAVNCHLYMTMWFLLVLLPHAVWGQTALNTPSDILGEYNVFNTSYLPGAAVNARIVSCTNRPFVFLLAETRIIVFDRTETGLVPRAPFDASNRLQGLLRSDQTISDARLIGGLCFTDILVVYNWYELPCLVFKTVVPVPPLSRRWPCVLVRVLSLP
jgi:hypothetical protein